MALGLQAHFGGGLTLKQGLGQAAQEGEVLGAIAFTEPTVVFMKGYIQRIIDESDEGYLYPAYYFFVIELPQKVERALRRTLPVTA